MVSNDQSDKLEPLHQRMYAQRSGTSAHTQTICRYVRHYLDVQATELGSLPAVRTAASVMREIVFSNRHALSASLIVSGWDPYEGYQIYSVNQTGFQKEGDYAWSGSGSVFLHGFLDSNYKPGMSRAEIVELCKSCISLACYRDGSSGGCIRLCDITKDKVTKQFFDYSNFLIK